MEYHPEDIVSCASYYFGRNRPTNQALRKLRTSLEGLSRPYACFMGYLKRAVGDRMTECTNLVIGNKMLEEYEDYYMGLENQANIITYSDFETFDIKMFVEDNPEKVLNNKHYSLSPLFRYMTADKLGLYGTARIFREDAINQLAENPFFFKMYNSGLPVALEDLLPKKEDHGTS